MRRHREDAGLALTNALDVTFGAFNLSDFRLPYMTAILSMEQAAHYLNLVKDDPTYASQDWTIKELYQREVDHFRVRDIADNYLVENSARPQFFNSLTVVLRPKDDFSGAYSAPSSAGDYAYTEAIGPIRIDFQKRSDPYDYPSSGTFGILRWNLEQVWATAIDGQHRLAAIKELRGRDPSLMHTSHISVIFIVLHPKLGFDAPADWGALKTMRSVFIDLNKRAVPVTRARNLLLDDLNPTAEFVRQLIGDHLKFEPKGGKTWDGFPKGTYGEFGRCLPLELVDWHGESKAKVERGPYVTSVLALDWIVRRLLKVQDIHVPERFDLDDVEDDEQYEDIRTTLKKWPRAWNSGIKEDWEEAKESRTFFYLTHEHVEALGKEFALEYGRPLTRLLTRPIPYRKVAEKRLESGTLTPEFGQWYQAKADKARHERSRLAEYFEQELVKVRKELKNEGVPLVEFERVLNTIQDDYKYREVLFFLVGQRALINAFLLLRKSNEAPKWSHEAEIDLTPFKDCMNEFYAAYLVRAFNALYRTGEDLEDQLFHKDAATERTTETEDLAREFWAGSLVKRDAPDRMDFSQNAAFRGSRWFIFLAHCYWFCHANRIEREVIQERIEELIYEKNAAPLTELLFGRELAESIKGVIGSKVEGQHVYRHPMTYLVQGLEEEKRTMEKVEAAGMQRISHTLDLCVEATVSS